MFRKILVAVDNNADNTEINRQIFDEAVSLAKAIDGSLMFLHVLFPFESEFLSPLFIEPHIIHTTSYMEAKNKYIKQWEEMKQKGIDLLTLLNNQASTTGVNSEFSLKYGDPGRMICQEARNWAADLIIVGRRGLSGLNEFLLGSVSNYVLHHAPCSVLTLQEPIYANTADATIMQAAST